MEETPILRADATDDDLQLDRGVEHVKAILDAGIAPTPGFASKPDDPHGDEITVILSHGYGSVSIGPDEYCGVSSCLTVKPPHRHPELEPAPGFATGGVVGKSGGPYGDEVSANFRPGSHPHLANLPVEDEPDNV